MLSEPSASVEAVPGRPAERPRNRDLPVSLDAIRERELGRVARHGIAYLDYAGSALYGDSQIRAHHALLARGIFGNPHSQHLPSEESSTRLASARARVLQFLDAPAGDRDSYAVVFTANASAAIKLIAESYPFGPHRGCVLSADNHNSVNGIREYARRANAALAIIPLDEELRLRAAEPILSSAAANGAGLFAYPAQSNFSGVRQPLALVERAHALGFDVLLDIAGYAPTHPFSLRACPADFVALSFYKLFGYPTGLGALVARRSALAKLRRPWFAGGTVEYASVASPRHRLRDAPDAFEDGTPDFLSVAALDAGFDLLAEAGLDRLGERLDLLTGELLRGLQSLRHASGAPRVAIYGPTTLRDRGATVAFNLLDARGAVVPYEVVEQRAKAAGIAVRGGCFCNPGAAEAAFGFDAAETARCFAALGDGFSIPAFRECLAGGHAVGAVRVSLGLATTPGDLERALACCAG
jgi:selenocysteine lyase/cysteine desulfurase